MAAARPVDHHRQVGARRARHAHPGVAAALDVELKVGLVGDPAEAGGVERDRRVVDAPDRSRQRRAPVTRADRGAAVGRVDVGRRQRGRRDREVEVLAVTRGAELPDVDVVGARLEVAVDARVQSLPVVVAEGQPVALHRQHQIAARGGRERELHRLGDLEGVVGRRRDRSPALGAQHRGVLNTGRVARLVVVGITRPHRDDAAGRHAGGRPTGQCGVSCRGEVAHE